MTYRSRAYWRMASWVFFGTLLILLGILLGRLVVAMLDNLDDYRRLEWSYLMVMIAVPGLVIVSHLISAFCVRALDTVISGLSPQKIDNQIQYLLEQKNWMLRNQICVNCDKMAYVCQCKYPTWRKVEVDDHRPDAEDKAEAQKRMHGEEE